MSELYRQSHHGFLYHQALAQFKWLSHGFSLRHFAGASKEYSLGFNGHIPDSEAKSNRRHFLRSLGFFEAIDPRAGDEIPSSMPSSSVLLSLRQIHSSLIHRAGAANWVVFPMEGDGICTEFPGLVLSILTADCMPILLVDHAQRVILALHSGWRGTAKQLPGQAIQFLRNEFCSDPRNCLAVIGPSIRSCCYQVGAEVREEFHQSLGASCECFLEADTRNQEKFRLDLPSAARQQLEQEGLTAQSIFADPPCTSCHTNLFFSHRREAGQTGRMMAAIGIRKPATS